MLKKMKKISEIIEAVFPTETKIILFVWWSCAILFVGSMTIIAIGATMSVLEYWGLK